MDHDFEDAHFLKAINTNEPTKMDAHNKHNGVLRLLLTPVMQDWPCWVIVDGLAGSGGCLGSTRKLHVGVVFKTETKMKFK